MSALWDVDRDGPGVVRSVDPMVRAIEAASAEDVALFVIALARAERDRLAGEKK